MAKKSVDSKASLKGKSLKGLVAEKIAKYIAENSSEALTLNRLADYFGISPYHLQRQFKESIGVSPKEYLEACRLNNFKDKLKKNKPVSEALYEAGFGSPSRVYEKLDKKIGMTPKQYRERGEKLEISYAGMETPMGKMLIAATDRGICFLQFGESEKSLIQQLNEEFSRAVIAPMPPKHRQQLELWKKAICQYMQGELSHLNLPLEMRGTAFQMKVWSYLQTIPYGQTQSYSEVASGLGQSKSVRAVASACARNRIALVIPCHRVLRGSGALAGYRWGLERKSQLLQIEKVKK